MPDEGLIVDMRSGGYINAWKPKHATVVGVRAFTDGKIVSHMVKATRGDVARILLGHSPTTPEEVADDRPRGRPHGRAQRHQPRRHLLDIKRWRRRADEGSVRQRRRPEG